MSKLFVFLLLLPALSWADVTLFIAATTDVKQTVDELIADDDSDRKADFDSISEAEDAKLTADQRKEARVAARIAEREARKLDRQARRIRQRQKTKEDKLLAKWSNLSKFGGTATWGGRTWNGHYILVDDDEVRRTVRKLREQWPEVNGDARIVVMWARSWDGSPWSDDRGAYGIHRRAIEFMPDDVVYDVNGVEVSRSRPTRLRDVILIYGQQPTDFGS